MDLFTYLMAKNDHNSSVNKDLFSYLLGKGQSGTYATFTGTSINANNTRRGKMKLSLYGNTSQTGTPTPSSPQQIHEVSGDNTITAYGINVWDEQWELGTFNVTTGANNSSTTQIRSKNLIDIFSNTLYYFNNPTSSNIGYWMMFYDKEGNIITGYTPSTNNSTSGNSFKCDTNKPTIVTPPNAKKMKFYLTVEYGATYNNDICININNASINGNYYPYTGTSYPINLPVENLFDKKGDIYYSWTGVDVTYDSDNQEYTFNGTLLTPGNATLSKGDLGISEGEEITLSVFHTGGNVTIPSGTGNIYAYSIFSQDNTIYIRGGTDVQEFLEKYTFTGNMIAKSGGNSDYVFLQLWRVGTTFDNYKIKIQIEKGSKSNSFTPYGTTPIELCKIGNYQDYLYKDSGKWYLHKEIGKEVVNFSRIVDISVGSTTLKGLYGLPQNKKETGGNGVFYERAKYVLVGNRDENTIYENPQNVVIVGSATDTLETLQEKFNGGLLYYILATPTTEEITNATFISQLDTLETAMSYKEQTNISQINNDIPFELEVEIKVKS